MREDAAVELPKKHCAFQQCDWIGECDDEIQEHIATNHGTRVDVVAQFLPAYYSVGERRASVFVFTILDARPFETPSTSAVNTVTSGKPYLPRLLGVPLGLWQLHACKRYCFLLYLAQGPLRPLAQVL